MTNTVTVIGSEKKEKKLSQKAKFAIFVVTLFTLNVIMSIVVAKCFPQLNVKPPKAMDFVANAVFLSLIGYFIFLRKKKREKTAE